jgi:hypothetical protein
MGRSRLETSQGKTLRPCMKINTAKKGAGSVIQQLPSKHKGPEFEAQYRKTKKDSVAPSHQNSLWDLWCSGRPFPYLAPGRFSREI